jgi:hypothetical protein
MPFHHRVNEGLIQCTDCHNPHDVAGEADHILRRGTPYLPISRGRSYSNTRR